MSDVSVIILSICYAEFHYAERCYAQCDFAKCYGALKCLMIWKKSMWRQENYEKSINFSNSYMINGACLYTPLVLYEKYMSSDFF